jgi:putative protease
MPRLNEYLEVGVDSLKVEGRNKTEFYAGSVARAYRMAIDDYYEDKENWDAEKYMDELEAISNRGYTLAFHEGRLTNLAHDYNSSRSSSFYEFAGQVVGHEGDSLIVEFKNRVVKGDVLEFMVPGSDEVILLRMYEFNLTQTRQGDKVSRYDDKIVDTLHGGQKPWVKIPLNLFHEENIASLKERLPINTLLRKEKLLEDFEKNRIELHYQAHKKEGGEGSDKKYDQKRDKYLTSIQKKLKDVSPRTPRVGEDGCCGKGCNGCLMFWHDDKYAKAREVLAQKKQGEML